MHHVKTFGQKSFLKFFSIEEGGNIKVCAKLLIDLDVITATIINRADILIDTYETGY